MKTENLANLMGSVVDVRHVSCAESHCSQPSVKWKDAYGNIVQHTLRTRCIVTYGDSRSVSLEDSDTRQIHDVLSEAPVGTVFWMYESGSHESDLPITKTGKDVWDVPAQILDLLNAEKKTNWAKLVDETRRSWGQW